jgi:hypothetical protein
MDTKIRSKADAAFRKDQKAAEASLAWQDHLAGQKAVENNMMRLRAERLARETLPESQGEKEKPGDPGRKSKNQNAGDRP